MLKMKKETDDKIKEMEKNLDAQKTMFEVKLKEEKARYLKRDALMNQLREKKEEAERELHSLRDQKKELTQRAQLKKQEFESEIKLLRQFLQEKQDMIDNLQERNLLKEQRLNEQNRTLQKKVEQQIGEIEIYEMQ